MTVYNKKLYRSREDRMIAGVLGGLGEYFQIDPVLLRVGFVCLGVFTAIFPSVLAYSLMVIVIPEKPITIHEEAKVHQN